MEAAQKEEPGRLVVSRSMNQSIRIGPDVTVTVISIDHRRVRLRVEAPRSVVIMRSELLERKEGE